MNAVDSSVVVAAVATWHESHELCRPIAAKASIPSHVLVEAYSVLTRIPAPHRLAAGTAAQILNGFFGRGRILFPSQGLMEGIVGVCGAAGIAGGAVYDALIGSIADEHGATLLTLDRRAVKTYELLGIRAQIVGD